MEDLKEHWMREIEEEVTEHSESLNDPNDNSADVDDCENDAKYSSDAVEVVTSFSGTGFDASAAANVSNLVVPDLTFDGTASTVEDMIDQHVIFDPSNCIDPYANSYEMSSLVTSNLMSQATGMSNFSSNTFDDVFLDGSYQQPQPQLAVGYEESLGSAWV